MKAGIKQCVLSILILLVHNSTGQNFNAIWSGKVKYNYKEGFYNRVIGENNSNVFVELNRYKGFFRRKLFLQKIKVFEKSTLKEVTTKTIYYKKDSKFEKYKGLRHFKSYISGDILYDFWLKEEDGSLQIFAASYDSKMKPIKKLTKLYGVKTGNERGSSVADYFVVANNNSNGKILVCAEPSVAKQSNFKLEYKLINPDLTIVTSNTITLPVVSTGNSKRNGASVADYEYKDNGILYIKNNISLTRDEYKELKGNDSKLENYYCLLSAIDPESGTINTFSAKLKDIYIQSLYILPTDKTVELVGYFTDLKKDPRGNDKHGLYFFNLNAETLEPISQKANYFTPSQLDLLFAKDKEDRHDSKLFKTKKKKDSEENSMPSDYIIEQAINSNNGDVVLFASRMVNYYVTVCTSNGRYGQTCRQEPRCNRSNVTAFKLKANGDIVWMSNLDRSMTYAGHFIYDLKAIERNNKYYVIYGSAFQVNATKKRYRTMKSGKQSRESFEYAVFDGNDGQYKKAEERINPYSTPKSERKYVSGAGVQVVNNQFYTGEYRLRMHPGRTIISCLSSVFCIPYYFTFANGYHLESNGFVGRLEPKN
ncbi:MAG: hypothetical protein IM600_04980 [Bacteroidetes bacterium]|nr:hypothetical protein [Bacteroidota bacterium]MCA6442767.1 hypothetical protein [Bacteroidota bacterium]